MALDKLKFWKKKEGGPPLDKELAKFEKTGEEFPKFEDVGEFKGKFGEAKSTFGEELEKPSSLSSFGRGAAQPPMRETPLQKDESFILRKDIEIISSKLDAIKAALESLDQRIAHLERIAAGESAETRRRW